MAVSTSVSDEELALSAHQGQREAFAALYERYVPGVYDFIARMSGNRDLAEDVVQSAFVNAWRDLQRREVRGNVKAWLYTIARNEALNQLRRNRRVVAGGDSLDDLRRASPFNDLDRSRLPDPEAALIDKELVDLVWESASALSPKEYSLLDMHLRRGLTADELAASLGVRRGNVYVMLTRLRDSLEESVTAALLMRRGRADCPQLDALLSQQATPGLNRELRRSIQAHLRECETCQASKRRYVAPAEIFSGLALVPLPAGSQGAIWAGILTLAAAGGAGVGLLGRTVQQAGRWWSELSPPAQLAVVGGGAATTVAGAVVAVVLIVALSGGGSGIDDPRDVRSTSHEIGEPSTDTIVSISWSPQPDADGYSVRWSASADDLPDTVAELPGDATGVDSPPLPEGAWYFHLRTRGQNGGWTSTVHLGPFVIEGREEPPEAAEPPGDGTTPSPTPTAVAGAATGPESGEDASPAAPRPATPATSPPASPSRTPPPRPAVTPAPTRPPHPSPSPSPTPPPGDDEDGEEDEDDDGHDDGDNEGDDQDGEDGEDDEDDGDDSDEGPCDGDRWGRWWWHKKGSCDGRPGECRVGAHLRIGRGHIRLWCKVFRP